MTTYIKTVYCISVAKLEMHALKKVCTRYFLKCVISFKMFSTNLRYIDPSSVHQGLLIWRRVAGL